ncbi:MAG: hypothetical protein JWM59_1811 [Verrucomicrobiales bacterium]|nr:hypothetical protein [Verrucomicrobiales bacterium]
MIPSGNCRLPFQGMTFGHRLLLLPLWFLAATIPTAVVFIFLNLLVGRHGDTTVQTLITFATAFPPSFLLYRWLVRPLRLDRRALCLWALMGVPLVAVAWGAFLAALAAVI